MVRVDVKRIPWLLGLAGLAGLMLSTAVWADGLAQDDFSLNPVDPVVDVVDNTFPSVEPCDPMPTYLAQGGEDGGTGDGGTVVIDDGFDGTVVDPTVIRGTVEDGTTVLDDQGTDEGSDATVDGSVTEDGGDLPEVIYDMTVDCIDCDVEMQMASSAVSDGVLSGGSLQDEALLPELDGSSGADVVTQSATRQSGDCSTTAVAWLCEWSKGASR